MSEKRSGTGLLERGESIPDSVRRFAARARARRWRTARTYVVLGVVVALLVGSAYVVLGTSVLSVRTVTVTGAKALNPGQVLRTAAVPHGANLARLDTTAIRDRLLDAYPGVDTVTVRRSFPSTVRLTVTERQVVAVLHAGTAYWLVDKKSVPFRQVTKPPKGFPVIGVNQVTAGDPASRAAVAVVDAIPADLAAAVVSIAAPTPDGITLHLTAGRTVFWGGAQDSARKFVVLRTLLKHPVATQSGGKETHYDVSSPDAVTVG